VTMKQRNIWFVIVTYRPERVLLVKLRKALEGWPVVIVDNTTINTGFGAGANRGMEEAFAAGAQWAVVCNQDIRLTGQQITHFCAIAQKCDPGIVGPEAGNLDPQRWTTILNENEREFHKATPSNKLHGGLEKPDYISGSMMAMQKNVWEKIGGFYEPYFMYYEDADLSVRAKNAGFTLREITLDGYRHESAGVAQYREAKEYYLARNHLLFVRRLAPLRVKIHEFLRLPKSLAEHHAHGNTEAIRGIGDFAKGIFGRMDTP